VDIRMRDVVIELRAGQMADVFEENIFAELPSAPRPAVPASADTAGPEDAAATAPDAPAAAKGQDALGGSAGSQGQATAKARFHDARPRADDSEHAGGAVLPEDAARDGDAGLAGAAGVASATSAAGLGGSADGGDGVAGGNGAGGSGKGDADGGVDGPATGYGEADTFVMYHTKSGPAKLERVITISDIKSVFEQSEGVEVAPAHELPLGCVASRTHRRCGISDSSSARPV